MKNKLKNNQVTNEIQIFYFFFTWFTVNVTVMAEHTVSICNKGYCKVHLLCGTNEQRQITVSVRCPKVETIFKNVNIVHSVNHQTVIGETFIHFELKIPLSLCPQFDIMKNK